MPTINTEYIARRDAEHAAIRTTCKGKPAWVPASVAPWVGLGPEEVVGTSDGLKCMRPRRRRSKLEEGLGFALYSIGGETGARIGFAAILGGLGWGAYRLLRRR
jgi:hypothetical protein